MITTLKKSTEVFRDKIAKLIYVGSTGQRLKFSMWPVEDAGGATPNFGNSDLYLYRLDAPSDSGTSFAVTDTTEWMHTASYFAQVGWTAANRRITYVQT